MRKDDLEPGSIYFGVVYEDEEYNRPILRTYEYLGESSGVEDEPFLFRIMGDDHELQLAEHNLDVVLDAAGLIEMLERFRDGKPMYTRNAT